MGGGRNMEIQKSKNEEYLRLKKQSQQLGRGR